MSPVATVRVEERGRLEGWARGGWLLLTVLAVLVGLASLRYALPGSPLHTAAPNFVVRHWWFVSHAVFASVALLVGPWQFLPMVRRRWRVAHRWMGRVYCVAVLLGWLTSVPIAMHASFGPVSSVGFVILGLLWAGFTLMGYLTIRRGLVAVHREWMMRSFAMTAAAITLRVWLPLMLVGGMPFPVSYRIVAWMCWIPNLLVAEVLVRRARRQPAGILVDGAGLQLQ